MAQAIDIQIFFRRIQHIHRRRPAGQQAGDSAEVRPHLQNPPLRPEGIPFQQVLPLGRKGVQIRQIRMLLQQLFVILSVNFQQLFQSFRRGLPLVFAAGTVLFIHIVLRYFAS